MASPRTSWFSANTPDAHALGLRCAELGYTFERRELDLIYNRFVALADQIKLVEDRHLLAIIHEEFPGTPMGAAIGTADVVARSRRHGVGVYLALLRMTLEV